LLEISKKMNFRGQVEHPLEGHFELNCAGDHDDGHH
jgi:hypothetical protein